MSLQGWNSRGSGAWGPGRAGDGGAGGWGSGGPGLGVEKKFPFIFICVAMTIQSSTTGGPRYIVRARNVVTATCAARLFPAGRVFLDEMHAATLLPALAAGALIAIDGGVPECDAYARQLNILFPAAPGTEHKLFCHPKNISGQASNPTPNVAPLLVAFGPNGTAAATRLAEYFEGNAPPVNITSNWTAARVERVRARFNRTSAECPCSSGFDCTGRVGNVSTCVPIPLPPPKVCFEGASATCNSLIAGGLGALGGGFLGLALVAYSPQ